MLKNNNWFRRLFFGILSTIFFVALFSLQVPAIEEEKLVEHYEQARVIKDFGTEEISNYAGFSGAEQKLEIEFVTGPYKGEKMIVTNGLSGTKGMDINVAAGNKVIICYFENPDAIYPDSIHQAYVADIVRTGYLKILATIFIILLIIIGARQGIKALLALGLTILCLYKIMLPALMQGYSPLLVTVLMLSAVTLLTMLLIAGFTRKALAATLGTIGGIIVAGFLAYLGGDFASLYGLSTEEERMLLYIENITFDTRGLLFSGILIGAIGAVMDVAMSVASALEEVKRANPDLNSWQLMGAAMRVGKDIMGTMANTLILAYVGGGLPILILFTAYQYPGIRILNSELIATEIVRALAGSIGIIISVPITAVVGALLNHGSSKRLSDDDY